jgi:hypothetical protein
MHVKPVRSYQQGKGSQVVQAFPARAFSRIHQPTAALEAADKMSIEVAKHISQRTLGFTIIDKQASACKCIQLMIQ